MKSDRTYLKKTAASSSISTKLLLEEISDGLKWLSERAFAFTVIFAAIAGWIWMDFLTVSKIPVSFLSSSLLQALPALLGVTIFIVVIFSYMLLLPSFILNTPISTEGYSLIDLERRSARLNRRSTLDSSRPRKSNWPRLKRFFFKRRTWRGSLVYCAKIFKELGKRLRAERPRRSLRQRLWATAIWVPQKLWQLPATASTRWLAMTIIIGLAWATSILLLTVTQAGSVGWWSLGIALLSAGLGSFYLCRGVENVKWSFRFQASFALAIQSYVAVLILDIAVHQIPSSDYSGYLVATLATSAALVLLALLQIAWSTIRASFRFYKGVVRDCIIAATGILIIIAMVPAVAGRLAGYAVTVSSSGARPCSVLVLRPEKLDGLDKRLDPAVLAPHNPTAIAISRPLSQVIQLDGMYYVKRLGDGNEKIFQIPREAVSVTEGCTSPTQMAVSSTPLRSRPGGEKGKNHAQLPA